jgi:hypothetical protein
MKRKIRGSGNEDTEVKITGEEAYQALDTLKKRNSQDRGGSRDAKAMSKLQDMADKSIRKNLEEPLTEDAQEGGVIGLTSQHGSFFKKGKK